MIKNEVIQEVQALHTLIMTNYDRPDWAVMVNGADAKAIVKLDILLQDVLSLVERKLYTRRWSVPSNSSSDYYDVIQLHDGSLECECKGFRYRRSCSHVDFIMDTELDERNQVLFAVQDLSLPNKYRLGKLLNTILCLMSLEGGKLEPVTIHSPDDLMVAELYALLTWLDDGGGAVRALREINYNPQEWFAVLRNNVGSVQRGWTPPPEAGLDLPEPSDPTSFTPPPLVEGQDPLFEPEYDEAELPW